MFHTEWSLVFFTTISQLAVGIMLALLLFVFAKKQNNYHKLNHSALAFAAGLMLIALVLSFLHLNNPINSVYALSNLKTSWLSREILFVSVFLFCLVVVNLILYFKNPGIKYYRIFIGVTTLMGLILVYTMSKLYIIPTVPPWNSVSTMIEFYSTALLIGSAFILGLSIQYGKNKGKVHIGKKTRVLSSIVLIAILIIFINELLFSTTVAEGNVAFKPQPLNKTFMLTRWITLVLGAASIIYIIYRKDRLTKMNLAFFLPFVFFLISELIARAAFYASYYRIGL
jgi:anaerobic dimethyl sulfoxide reductase subunit C (anchor subunit)